MYIVRPIDTLLLEWKNSQRLKPLLLRGARQVGKSWAVKHLGETFEYYIEVNFEKRPDMLEVFQKIHDVHELANIYILRVIPWLILPSMLTPRL
jgi:predicted AAA+ superfamily ATPase